MLHVAGDAIQFGDKVIQRCALCGCRMIHTTIVKPDMETFPVYDAGTLVWIETPTGDVAPTCHEVDTLESYPNILYPDVHKWRATLCTEMETR